MPADAEIRRILAERVDVHRQSVGMVVGVLEPSGRRIVTQGSQAKGDPAPLDGDTLFEIGSITKVFTTLLLADAVQRGEVALADPVSKYLPPEVKMPERGGRAITLADLATHTSGLPRLPTNFAPGDASNPYADYSVQQLYDFLSAYPLPRDIGSQYEYSNLGMGLLGHALARRAGMPYESLVRERITGPLGMTNTVIALSPDQRARMATGHDAGLEPTPLWDLPTLAGAGALRSSANDLLTFLAAALGVRPSPLDAAFQAMTAIRRPAGSPQMEIALGWHVRKGNDTEIIWHNGGTGGFRTWMGYNPRSRTGVVLLANAGMPEGPDDIGPHLLAEGAPLRQFPKPREETTLDPAVFDRYVGRYQLAPAAILTISRDGNRFLVQLTGQQAIEIFAESQTKFFLKAVDAQLTFENDAQNKPTAVTLHQNGVNQRAPRIEGEPLAPREIALGPAVLDRYVGTYQLAPGVLLSVTRQGAKLLAQLTGQPTFEVYASGERDFFYKVVNAQLTFEGDGQDPAPAVVLHQNGADHRATRVSQ
ncbi:MAG: serine hydrolase [Verrucomicrobiae bacterium]|nr:serine hydrolase [Verrucomicrobiae bacterium]